MAKDARFGTWAPHQHRGVPAKVEGHLQARDNLGFEVGEGSDLIRFLAGLRDMDAVDALIRGAGLTPREREWLLNGVEECQHQLSRPSTKPSVWTRMVRRISP
jgi:hypothetical protein